MTLGEYAALDMILQGGTSFCIKEALCSVGLHLAATDVFCSEGNPFNNNHF